MSLTDIIGKFLPHTAAPPAVAAIIAAKAAAAPYHLSLIPNDALTFVFAEEDGSPTYYATHYTGFEWPLGASGPTVGVGYDLGYVTRAEAEADWGKVVSPDALQWMLRAVGLRGEAAEVFVRAHAHVIDVTFDQAMAEFKGSEEPKWLARCRAALPNFDAQPPLCQGAIFSVTYNRGSGGYDDPSPRDAEMREIKRLVAAGQFDKVPMEISAMRRLWPPHGDLWNRRLHEAALYQRGLQEAPAKAAA